MTFAEHVEEPEDVSALVEEVIGAADGPSGVLDELATTAGEERVSRLLVDEVIARATPPVNEIPILIEFTVCPGVTCWLRVVRDQPITPVSADDGFIGMRIEYALSDLARELFGPLRERPAGARSTAVFPYLTDYLGFDEMGARFAATQQATQAVLAGCTMRMPNLAELATRYGTPKFGSMHWFTPHYERHFCPYRGEQVRVLEIGIGGYRNPNSGGSSLRMWKHFFPRGHIFGLDIEDKSHIEESRITVLRGDQGEAGLLAEVGQQHGPFDIVIDDGSHINQHVRTSFGALLPYVRPGGLYVIEDLFTSYWPGFGGSEDPQRSDGTSLGLLKSVIDAIQHQELLTSTGQQSSYLDQNAVGLHVYHNVAFLEKGRNAEGAVPFWIPRDFDRMVATGSGEDE